MVAWYAIWQRNPEPTVVVTYDSQKRLVMHAESLNTARSIQEEPQMARTDAKKLPKMRPNSGRYKRQNDKVKKRLKKTRSQRNHTECVAAKKICNGADVIVMKRLHLAKMTRKGRKKRHLNREMRHVRRRVLEQRISNRAQINNRPHAQSIFYKFI